MSKKIEALIEREGAAYVVADLHRPVFIGSTEDAAVAAAHAFAYLDESENKRILGGEGRGSLPEIFRVPLNTVVRMDDNKLYGSHYGEWGRVGTVTRTFAEMQRAEEERRLFAADRPDTHEFPPRDFPTDPAVAPWVWTSKNELSYLRSWRFAVFSDEARAIQATKPSEPLFGLLPGGRTSAGRYTGQYLIRGWFGTETHGSFGYREGHGLTDPRHPSQRLASGSRPKNAR